MPQLKNTHQLERRARAIVESLKGTWRQGRGMCCCPAHDDRTPSLSVTLGRKAILFHCFAGCSNEDVIAALDRQGVRSRELFHGSGAGTVNRRSIGTPYRRAKGTPLLRWWVVDAGRGFRAAGGVGRA
jgi:hypothetical protein